MRTRHVLSLVVLMSLLSGGCGKQELEAKVLSLEQENGRLRSEVTRLQADAARVRQDLTRKDNELTALRTSMTTGQLGVKDGDKLFATLRTSMGDVVAELYPHQAPNTVLNFVQLAEGTRSWTDPKTGQSVTRPLYDGTIFHRVIPDFMVQAGDPLGNGTGGPGYTFADELHPSLHHDGPGILSMANSGPGTNGSQFFITEKATPWLDKRHTIFGRVVEGQDIVTRIARVPRNKQDRPEQDVILKQVLIGRGAPKK